MSLTALVLLIREPGQAALSPYIAQRISEQLLRRVQQAAKAGTESRLAVLERQNVALQLCLAALVRQLSAKGQLTKEEADRLAEIAQRAIQAQAAVEPVAPAPIDAKVSAVTEAAAALAAAGAQAERRPAPPHAAVTPAQAAAAAAAIADPTGSTEAVEVMALEVPSDPDQLAQWSEDLAALCQALDSPISPKTASYAFPPPARLAPP